MVFGWLHDRRQPTSPTQIHGRTGSRTANAPAPQYDDIAGTILSAKISAPGLDGVPYELMHYGLNFMVHLVGQAHYAAQRSTQDLNRVLGPNCDLLLWIPKKSDAYYPDGQRPLQLPTCFRRIFSSTIMNIVGPKVEPHFTEFQAAIKGGSCGPNISSAYKHLAREQQPPTAPNDAVWDLVMAPSSHAAASVARQADSDNINHDIQGDH